MTFEAQAAWTSPAVRFDLMDGGDYLRTMRTMLNEYPSTYAYGSGILTGATPPVIGNGDNRCGRQIRRIRRPMSPQAGR